VTTQEGIKRVVNRKGVEDGDMGVGLENAWNVDAGKLICKYTNLRSILNKKDEIGILMNSTYLDILESQKVGLITISMMMNCTSPVLICFVRTELWEKRQDVTTVHQGQIYGT